MRTSAGADPARRVASRAPSSTAVDLSTATVRQPFADVRARSERSPHDVRPSASGPLPGARLARWTYLDLTERGDHRDCPPAIRDSSSPITPCCRPASTCGEKADLSGACFVGDPDVRSPAARARTSRARALTGPHCLKGCEAAVGANLALANLDSAFLIAESGAASALEAADAGPPGQGLEAAVVTDAFLVQHGARTAHTATGWTSPAPSFVTASAREPESVGPAPSGRR